MIVPTYTTEISDNDITHYFGSGVVIVVNTPLSILTLLVNGLVKASISTLNMSAEYYLTYIKNAQNEARKMGVRREEVISDLQNATNNYTSNDLDVLSNCPIEELNNNYKRIIKACFHREEGQNI